ncbi:50S ribosomal protein L19e [Candidatus Woesearchaeota archaeon]|nr:50S ribosomal protein L19e [Candidatus Woesearchaeota archaeon]
MNLRNKKLLAARILNVGKGKIVFDQDRLEEIKEAITSDDIRGLISHGAIIARNKIGISSLRFKKRLLQKRKGRRQGKGSRKGKRTSRLKDKDRWIHKIRSQRRHLRLLKIRNYLSKKDFRGVYRKAGGGFFRSKGHLKLYLEENKLVTKKNDAIQTKKKK